jgi:hypothetical protein
MRVIKSRSIGWDWHVAYIRKIVNEYKIAAGKSGGKDYSKDLGIDEGCYLI